MTGGSVNRSAGVLSRANELKTLRGKLSGMQEKLRQAAQRAEEASREVQKAEYELNVAREQQRRAEDDVLTLEGRQNHYDILTENLRLSCQSMEDEREALERRGQSDSERMQQVRAAIGEQEKLAAALRAQAEENQAGRSDLAARTDALSERLSEKKAERSALAAERESSLRSRSDLQQLQEDMRGGCDEQERLRQEMREAIEKAREDMTARRSRAEALQQQGAALRGKLSGLARQKMELEAKRSTADRESRECNDTLLNCEREVARLEQKRSHSAMEEKQILDRLWEHYELSHSEALQQRVELESVPKATRRIAELNREIKALGTPNIGAIEEFERVNTRYTYLSEQRTDVEKAKEELGGIIEEITKQMTVIFAEQFALLNESFQQTFLELFGGGKACLELEDENDILNCGIEIKVQPPGKQLKTITLLSGGEKAFVAIALYFAILKVHPTPFCVMDEIEAALDEANVVRYARYMRRIAGKTQFIVITHRRGTMEEADVLYGVTMQERGVSRILTINLNDMAKELKIK